MQKNFFDWVKSLDIGSQVLTTDGFDVYQVIGKDETSLVIAIDGSPKQQRVFSLKTGGELGDKPHGRTMLREITPEMSFKIIEMKLEANEKAEKNKIDNGFHEVFFSHKTDMPTEHKSFLLQAYDMFLSHMGREVLENEKLDQARKKRAQKRAESKKPPLVKKALTKSDKEKVSPAVLTGKKRMAQPVALKYAKSHIAQKK